MVDLPILEPSHFSRWLLLSGSGQSDKRKWDSRFASTNLATPYYWLFPLLLYFCKIVAGSYSLSLALVIQFFVSCANLYLLIKLYFNLFEQNTGWWLVLLFSATCYDILQWGHYLLTDIYSIFLMLLYLLFCISKKRGNVISFFILPLPDMMLLEKRRRF